MGRMELTIRLKCDIFLYVYFALCFIQGCSDTSLVLLDIPASTKELEMLVDRLRGTIKTEAFSLAILSRSSAELNEVGTFCSKRFGISLMQ